MHNIEMTDCDCCHKEYHERSEGFTFTPVAKDAPILRLCNTCVSGLQSALCATEEEEQALADRMCDGELQQAEFDRVNAWTNLNRILCWADSEHRITKVEQMEQFFDDLCGLLTWHPDDDFATYVWTGAPDEGKPIFDAHTAKELNTRMEECRGVVAKGKSLDLYEAGLAAMHRAGRAPKPPVVTQPREDRLLETVGDIAYVAGVRGFHSGDSRADMALMIAWAREFETKRVVDGDGNETYNGDDYMTAVETFAGEKLHEQGGLTK